MLGHDQSCILHWSCKGKCTCGYDQWQLDNKPTHTIISIVELTAITAERNALRAALEEAVRCYDVWFADLHAGRLNCHLSDYWSSDKVDIARNAIGR